jgi:hypothetical protein
LQAERTSLLAQLKAEGTAKTGGEGLVCYCLIIEWVFIILYVLSTVNKVPRNNLQLHTLLSIPLVVMNIKSRRMKCVGHGPCMGERSAYRILVWKPEGNKVGDLNKVIEWVF